MSYGATRYYSASKLPSTLTDPRLQLQGPVQIYPMCYSSMNLRYCTSGLYRYCASGLWHMKLPGPDKLKHYKKPHSWYNLY
eukprot:2578529-Rhodomonas_salina.3